MKNTPFLLLFGIFIVIFPSNLVYAQVPGQVLLNLNYENNSLNSGNEDIDPTGVDPNIDAAYMVSPGATGQYAIGHKIIGGNPAYQSDGNTRSESDALKFMPARFYPGDIHRYEFSVLLKDWVEWDGGLNTETTLFQLKITSGVSVPFMLSTVRNALRIRYGIENGIEPITNIITDVRPLVNQWLHFRVDVEWSTSATGSFKTYMKLPGQSDYTLADEKLNYHTFIGNTAIGNVGYIKWGLYVAPLGVTRLAHFDDIRIINLTPIPLSNGLIWGNSIPDNNPAYLDGPYTKVNNMFNRDAYDNSNHIYMHPYLNFRAAGNIVYSNSTNPVPNANDNIIGTPRSDFTRTTLTRTGGSSSLPGPSGRYFTDGWTRSSNGTPTAINLTEYYEFQLEPIANHKINFTDIKFTVRRGADTHPNTFVLRSSFDNFSNNISTPMVITGTTATLLSFNASVLKDISSSITFRLYAYGATIIGGANSSIVGLNDFQFFGQVLPSTLPISLSSLTAYLNGNSINVKWQINANRNISYFEIQTSRDGNFFTTVQTVQPKNSSIQSYEAALPVQEISTLLILPLTLGFFSLVRIKKRYHPKRIVAIVFFTMAIFSCKKQNTPLKHEEDTIFIRIKQVDMDGQSHYSDIVSVKLKKT